MPTGPGSRARSRPSQPDLGVIEVRRTEPEAPLAAANERLLVRLGFDLHDGPLQQVYVLAQDVRVLRDRVAEALAPEHRQQALDSFADLEAQLAELNRDLRDLAHSLEPRSLLQQPLHEAVERELTTLEQRTGISTSLTLQGQFDALTDSQRIALLRVLHEALSNIRRHSGSRTASVDLTDNGDGVRMEIRDDGRGFTAETAEPNGEPPDGIGLVGMRERMRLLGGRLELISRPGGPTTVIAHVPRWVPPVDA
jgi:two-component system, NarL family, sensor histidine kinase UhpB